MDFFGQQERAIKQTRLLVCLFALAVLVVMIIIYLVLALVARAIQHPVVAEAWWNPMTFLITVCVMFGQALMHPLHFLQLIWNPQHAGWIALGTLVSVALGCAYALLSIAVEAHRAAG